MGFALIASFLYFSKINNKAPEAFKTEKPFKATIINKTVATGKLVPLEEVEIKPQISGIIKKIVVEEGALVKKGDLIAIVRVVPNEQSLSSASGRIGSIKINVSNAKTVYTRNKTLFDKGVISRTDFEASELAYNQAKQDLRNAQSDYQIIRKGSRGSSGASTNIRAEISGTVLEIPVKVGSQVIQSNNFNAGTTIASIADMTKMIFEGQVDEAEVGKLQKDTNIAVSLGAIDKKKFPAKLNFIAPKGTEAGGAVQFKIKADVTLDDQYFIRAGYSANADIVLAQKDSVLSIRESILQFDEKTEAPYVEVKTGENKFEKKEVELGLSDGINVEILSGISEDDELKIWNKADKGNKKKKKGRRRD